MIMSHHAYVYYASDTAVLPLVLQKPSVDTEHFSTPRWGIADSRRVQEAALRAPLTASQRSIIIHFAQATVEAQNALLKVLEEPNSSTVFYLLVPNPQQLLETVRSRLQPVALEQTGRDTTEYQQFVSLPLAERLERVVQAAKEKDTTWQHAVFSGALLDTTLPAPTRLLLDQYKQSPGASVKMLLEELALTLAEVDEAR